MGETKQEGVTVVYAGSDQSVNQDCSTVGGERGAEPVYVPEVEICRPDGVVDVGVE